MSLKDRHAGKVAYATIAAAAPGHARSSWSETDDGRESKPRIPLIGVDAGCIPGTAPGCSASALERTGKDLEIAGRELVKRKLRAARGRA